MRLLVLLVQEGEAPKGKVKTIVSYLCCWKFQLREFRVMHLQQCLTVRIAMGWWQGCSVAIRRSCPHPSSQLPVRKSRDVLLNHRGAKQPRNTIGTITCSKLPVWIVLQLFLLFINRSSISVAADSIDSLDCSSSTWHWKWTIPYAMHEKVRERGKKITFFLV